MAKKAAPPSRGRATRVTVARPARPESSAALLLHGMLRVVSIVCLPFAVLVRVSVDLYRYAGFPGWLAITIAGTLSLAIITLYGAWISRRLSGKPRIGMVVKWVALPLVISYCGYALLFLARANAKTDAVRSTYLSTHPLLRLALSTVILVDRDVVVTDLARTPDDYRRMGLTVRQASLHYPQRDGWVHAVDLRTTGRSFLENTGIWLYFRFMGFETLRHEGTADHLHVALPPH